MKENRTLLVLQRECAFVKKETYTHIVSGEFGSCVGLLISDNEHLFFAHIDDDTEFTSQTAIAILNKFNQSEIKIELCWSSGDSVTNVQRVIAAIPQHCHITAEKTHPNYRHVSITTKTCEISSLPDNKYKKTSSPKNGKMLGLLIRKYM